MTDRIRAIVVMAAITAGLGLLSSTAAARDSNASGVPAVSLRCAGHTMSLMNARHSVLVTLREFVNGKPRQDFALPVKLWLGSSSRSVGYAHPGCWTSLPLRTTKSNPLLCLVVRLPFRPLPSNDGRPAACPRPRSFYYKGVRWVTYTFQVTYAP